MDPQLRTERGSLCGWGHLEGFDHSGLVLCVGIVNPRAE